MSMVESKEVEADDIQLEFDDAERMRLIQSDIDDYVAKDKDLRSQYDQSEAQIEELKQKMGLLMAERLGVQGAAEALETMKQKMGVALDAKYDLSPDVTYELNIDEGKMVKVK